MNDGDGDNEVQDTPEPQEQVGNHATTLEQDLDVQVRAALLEAQSVQTAAGAERDERREQEVLRGASRSRGDDDQDTLGDGETARTRRRRTVRYKQAIANHEDFNVSSVAGENVVNNRHKLPPPRDVCPFCKAWKIPGESAVACCVGGKVQLPGLNPTPELLAALLNDEHFFTNIRPYNQVFCITSIGAMVTGGQFNPVREDTSVQGQRGVYNYRIQGAMSHYMGALLPNTHPLTGEVVPPKFAQIYVYDPDMQERAKRRHNIFSNLDPVVLLDLETMFAEINPFAREFISMGERLRELVRQGKKPVDVAFELHANNRAGPRTHNLPDAPEIAAVLVTNGEEGSRRDILLFPRQGGLLRIFETLRIYDPAQYFILFPYGELGWSFEDTYANNATHANKRTMSLGQHVSFRLFQKQGERAPLHLGGRLFQQWCVDQRAKIEQEQLRWVAANQATIRADDYAGIRDAYLNEAPVQLGENEGLLSEFDRDTGELRHPNPARRRHFLEAVGQRVVLPASHTGSDRYMYEQYQNSMAMVREYGKPDLFMTMTCNPQWEEITSITSRDGPHRTAQDRPDVVARVWNLKLKALLKDLDEGVLGYQVGRIYVVEFQKRGLPHAHILIILADADKPKTRADYDRFVSAELPDPEKNPALYSTVLSSMIHGPCGDLNPNSPCMKDGKCTKGYPKDLSEVTQANPDSFPIYRRRRREAGTLKHKRREFDNATINRWVVPYNPYFCQKYDCHINLEICSTISAIKYLYKYVYKGSDKTEITLLPVDGDTGQTRRRQRELNEIIRHINARYISPIEACVRIFEFPINGKTHKVEKLPVHLPDLQFVSFRTSDDPQRVLGDRSRTKLTQFFQLATTNEEARQMLYQDIPKRFKWANNTWVPYKNRVRSIGRMVHVSPQDPERFYLRLMLCHRRGPTSFEDLRTVDGQVYETFKEAAMRAGYLEDDSEWQACMSEAAVFQMPRQLRQLFVTILLYSLPSDIRALWNAHYAELSRDFEFRFRALLNKDKMVMFKTLASLHDLLQAGGKTLADFPDLPQLSEFPDMLHDLLISNSLIRRELEGYDQDELRGIVESVGLLNPNQKDIYDAVLTAVNEPSAENKLFFIDGPGGTGKSTLLNHILAKVRLQGGIVVAVASSGIASLLLPGGRTAHSTFKIPLKLTATSTSYVKKRSKIQELLARASLIVWDEAPMTHRFAFEAVDRTLRDVLENEDEPFGGKPMVLSGDFRQILPVVKRGTPADTIQACLKSSPLWRQFKQVHLTVNMRVQSAANGETAAELSLFSDFLLQVGEGRHITHSDLDETSMKMPRDIVIANPNDEELTVAQDDDEANALPTGLSRVVDAMYSEEDMNNPLIATNDYFAQRTILAPTNTAVQRVNEAVAQRLRENPHVYYSTDSVEDSENSDMSAFFETEVLNSIHLNGIPPHKLILKKGIPVMMMRNLNPDEGLCNGTRLRITELQPHVIRATIMTGAHDGKEVLIPRIVFISDNDNREFPFRLRRKQFPIVPAFAMTINKAQGQTVHNLALYLPTPCFSHGQLYVALSRVTARSKFKALIENPDMEEEDGVYTSNIVYRQIFE